MAKHLERLTHELDPTDGETAAYINDARKVLQILLDAASEQDVGGLGDGGPYDNAAHLIGFLSGSLADEGLEYALELWAAAACQTVDANRDLSHWF